MNSEMLLIFVIWANDQNGDISQSAIQFANNLSDHIRIFIYKERKRKIMKQNYSDKTFDSKCFYNIRSYIFS